jgi:tRNA A37 methylthiotransferase MiaB
MKRRYDVAETIAVLQCIHTDNPHIELHTQVIVGFPSETAEDFQNTLDTLARLPLRRVIVFPYHEKVGTEAAAIEPKVPNAVIQQRTRHALRFLKQRGVKAVLSCDDP